MVATKTALKLSWTATPGATGYAIRVDQLGGGGNLYYSTLAAQTYVTTKTNFEVTNLLSNTPYDVNVAAVNQGGSTGASTALYTR